MFKLLITNRKDSVDINLTQMALDGKTIIKEEITDKDAYEATTNNNGRRSKGGNSSKDNCRTPDSPESARAVAPRSPMSPQIHHSSLAPPPRPNRNASSSPVVNGATTTPPPSSSATSVIPPSHLEQSRQLGKMRKFFGSLVQFSQEVHPEASDRIRALVLSLASSGISIDEFRIALQEAINLPLRSYVMPFLKGNITLLQRDISVLARASNQTTLQYVTSNENAVMEFSHSPPEHTDIFLPPETTNGNGILYKRRPSDTVGEHHNGVQDWADYMYPPSKRLHTHTVHLPGSGSINSSGVSSIFSGQPSSLFEYPGSVTGSQVESGFGGLLDKQSVHREERVGGGGGDIRGTTEAQRMNNNSRMGGEEEWKNIHTMLNCISAMVDKTKRAITILQQRGVDTQPGGFVDNAAVVDIRRQTEEKVAEFKRNAEEAVNQVKRQAVIEIQRAVSAAESRAADVMAQERLRMEKFFVEMSRHANDRDLENKSPSVTPATTGQNACWNCGRKANETCSGCNMARYCGAFCQHKDWEHHHQICGNSRTDVNSKHPSQSIPTAPLRGAIVRSPPTAPQPSQPLSQPASLSNGVNSGGGSK